MSAAVIPAGILAERQRQIDSEGYDQEHDDGHVDGELLSVAMIYYRHATRPSEVTYVERRERADDPTPPARYTDTLARGPRSVVVRVPSGWPWDAQWWKPKTPQRDLDRAGALCLAEIDRLKRAGRTANHVELKLGLIIIAYRQVAA